MKKKKYFAWIISGANYKESLDSHSFFFEKLSKNFEKIYYINICNLSFFGNEKKGNPPSQKDMPYNFIYFEPGSFFEFKKFLKDKKLIGVCNFGKDFEDLKHHLILNFLDIKFIQISNIGNIQWSHFVEKYKPFIVKIKFRLLKYYTQKLINFLSIIGLVPKIQLRFLSDRTIIENIKKNKLKYLFYKLKLFYAKELILVNSRAYDMFLEKKLVLSDDFIVLLDYDLNHPDDKMSHQTYSEENYNTHYNYLKSFLDDLSKKYNRKVVVTIHPRDNLDKKKKIFSNYEVVQFKTQEFIGKAFIVIFFDSSAIVDAILMKKRIVTLVSRSLGRLVRDGSNKYSSLAGIYQTILDEIDNSKIEKIVNESEKRIPLFNKYIAQNIAPDGKEEGYKKIIHIIKERFF